MPVLLPHLLQSLTEFQIQSDPKDQIGFVVSIVLLTALLIYMNISRIIRNSKAFKGEGVELPHLGGPKVDSQFYKIIKPSSLTKNEMSKLEKILKFGGEYPEEVLFDNAKLDTSFEYAYDKILREYSPEDAQQELFELFSIRNAVEYFLTVKKNGGRENVPHKFRRKQAQIKCDFYLVVEKTVRVKSKLKKKLVLADAQPHQGTLLNVSQSGCAIMSAQDIKAGSFLKIEFEINHNMVAALGSILRFNMNAGYKIYHIKFLKLSKSSIIALNSFIFGYK
jgi:hypothetical protein